MLFQNVRAFFTEAVTRFALNQFVDEIGGFDGPPLRDLVRVDLHLLGEDVVADLLSVLAVIGTLTEHAFVSNYSHGEVVDSDSVVLTAHHFGCHVAGRS